MLLLAGGIGLAVFAGWVMPDPLGEVSRGAAGVRWYGFWRLFLRLPAPLLLAFALYYAGRDLVVTLGL